MLRSFIRTIPVGEGIIHVHNHHDALTALLARLLARRPDIRIVFTRHRATRGRDSRLRRLIYSSVDSLLFVSRFSLSRFLSAWPDGSLPFLREKALVCYNSLLDPCDTVPPEPQKGPVVAMYRGSLKRGKGLETLIDALSLLREEKIRLRIVGSGDPDYRDILRRRATRRGVMERIDWPRRGNDDLESMADCHFGVLPAIEPEAFGMANMEFMAYGRPQVCTMTGGQREFITPGVEALEVTPADAVALADAIRTLARDAELRRNMGAAAREKYDRMLSWPHFIRRISKAYGDM